MESEKKESESCEQDACGCQCGCRIGGDSCIRRNLTFVAILSALLVGVFVVLYLTR